MLRVALLGLLPYLALVNAAVLDKKAGTTTSDVFPPASTTVNTAVFPDESEVGYPGITVTGVEPAAIQTAPASLYAYNTDPVSSYPLVSDHPEGSDGSDGFDITKHWGNLSPWYSVPSSYYGLNDTSPNTPEGCSITQVHLLYRHGARYPTSGAPPSAFATKIANATAQSGGFNASGELEFLNDWSYLLGAELLTVSGRLQNFALGASFRQQYGYLLNNFTEAGTLPVFRTESQDRMVKTANNFAAGMFGVPEYLDQVNIEIMVETPGVNNTGAPYENCPNSNIASRGSIGSTAANAFAKNAFNGTLERLQNQITGVNLTSTDIIAMLELCSYETDALGYSAFCKLFTEEDFENYEYYFDISFYYNNGAGSPVAAAQGKGFLAEFVARFTQSIPSADSSVNSTLDNNPTYFPLNQSIYADATHEVVLLDTFTAFNLTALFSSGPVATDKRMENSFRASQVVPFATHMTIQVLECSNTSPSKQIRFIINDAVLPIDKSYAGCEYNKDGMCSFDTVVDVLQKRLEEIDWDYDCLGNYTASPGNDYNGRAPRD
ncbi:uncharacterized protein I303_103318 [Kwoniella dejecticola CBS 10117]|uniref:Acid phosphatase n=1 Tax=Kwoniella dejecticola CBS 10117 TaxID=1296121 RepID=A0A1A6A6E8_9TREE|nr:acid phosphatase [Kwoniella dejecticola CBS 10117]OBR85630.1 acid phosphatase [Kwoniella dejecticola CBS 10117]